MIQFHLHTLLKENKMKWQLTVAVLFCLLTSTAHAQIVSGVMTVTGAEMH